jgi:putative solute:sodium symporter small subunit
MRGKPMGENLKAKSENSKKPDEQAIRHAAYWRANLRLLGKLLAVWFVVSFGFGILLKDLLNEITFFGFRLGFWFAQQGSIYVFVVLIFIYVWRMAKIDRDFGVED